MALSHVDAKSKVDTSSPAKADVPSDLCVILLFAPAEVQLSVVSSLSIWSGHSDGKYR